MTEKINIRSDFEAPFKDFITALAQSNILNINKNSAPTYIDKKAFMDLGQGLFVAYLVAGIRSSNSSYYFVKVNNHKTLMVVDPIDLPLVPLHTRAKMSGLYIDHPQEGFEETNCCTSSRKCAFEAFLAYNASHLPDHSYMPRILKEYRKSSKSCKTAAKQWLEYLYNNKKDTPLQSLGGYTIRLNVSPKVFQYLFSVTDADEDSSFTIAEKNFNMFLTTLIGIETRANIAEPEAYIEKGKYKTYATDGLISSDKKLSKLIALETTIGVPDKEGDFITQFLSGAKKADRDSVVSRFAQLRKDHHFKQKFITYTTIKNLEPKSFKYLYCVFGELIFDDKDFRSAYSTIASKEPGFQLITLQNDGRKLVINLRKNWWNVPELEGMYDQFIGNLMAATHSVFGE